MIKVLSDNIVSPLGLTTEENLSSVESRKSELKLYEGKWGIPEKFMASLMPDGFNYLSGYTRWESLAILSIQQAIASTDIDVSSSRVVFVFSTTKGNIELLDQQTPDIPAQRIYLWEAARQVTTYFHNIQEPIVVSNACTSGVCAQIIAQRLLDNGLYDYAIVVGAEVQSKFIVSGFQSFKAVSSKECRPFDIERQGLNLGEAAATIILTRSDANTDNAEGWFLIHGAIHNDAYHISNPSKTGEGAFRCLIDVMAQGVDSNDLAVINAHGTSTMFNDEMEAKAIYRAGLSDVPVNSLKGYFGHTMGAAGVLETILTLHATDKHIVLATRGFKELGVSKKIDVAKDNRITDKHSFIKLISGFGGVNAAVRYVQAKPSNLTDRHVVLKSEREEHKTLSVKISPNAIEIDHNPIRVYGTGTEMLKDVYKRYVGNYPKFYKMDTMCKIGLLASELLLHDEYRLFDDNGHVVSNKTHSSTAVVIFSSSGSISDDLDYYETIKMTYTYFPSPSLFVYTLPNIVTGEIAIRNGYLGETHFFALSEYEEHTIETFTKMLLNCETINNIILGWIDCFDNNSFQAEVKLIKKDK